MKLVTNTQYLENYGAHDWSGEGECPQYWKFKGGNTYVIENVEDYDSALSESLVNLELTEDLVNLITYRTDYSEEYVIESTLMMSDDTVCEEWETPYVLEFDTDIKRWRCTRTTSSRTSDFQEDILEMRESWLLAPNNEREDYRVLYTMKNGDMGIGKGFLNSWFKINKLFDKEVA
jgi:hypothetical protein